MSCFALPSSHVPSPIPISLFLFSPFFLLPSIPRWLLPTGAVRACEALRAAASLTYFRTASNSVWEVNLQWHVQYVAQMFLPSPELSHAIRSVADKGYGLEIRGKWSTGWEVKQRLALTLMRSSYTPACSYLRTRDGRGGDVWGGVAKPPSSRRGSPPSQRESRGGFLWVRAAVSSQITLPALLWAPSLPGQQKREPCAFQLSAVMCRNISADIFTGKILANLRDILCQTLVCPKRLPFF